MERKKKKVVILDLDGTLLDTLTDLADSMNYVLREAGFPERSMEEIRKFVGNGVRRLVERAIFEPSDSAEQDTVRQNLLNDMIMAEQEQLTDQLFANMKTYYEGHCNLNTGPYPGVVSCLRRLAASGLQLAIVSNKLDEAVKELAGIYFPNLITMAVGDSPKVRTKPEPDMIEMVLRQLNVTAAECVYVGDSEVDLETARNAGLPCISVTWGFRDKQVLQEHDAVLFADTPEQLADLLLIRQKDYRYLLFDLDGTLTNPEEGITKGVQHALKSFGIQADRKDLLCFIGPPLWDSFRDFYGFDEEKAEQAVEKYRELYHETGVFENFAYDGIPELLRELKQAGYYLAVATSKPEVTAKRVLERYELEPLFDVICGSEMDGSRSRKSEVIEEALARFRKLCGNEPHPIKPEQVLMIGDRKFDVTGAKEAGLDCVGVYYGFAEPGELEEAGADYVTDTVAALKFLLLEL